MRDASEKPGGALAHRSKAWIGWFLVTFALWNSCSSHEASRASDATLSRGNFPLTPAFAVAALRGAGTDDTDVARYLAYANATLGRPYRSYYVRAAEGWAAPAHSETHRAGGDDPTQSVTIVPEHRLMPYRDFSVEYPPGFLLFALAPALLNVGLDEYRTVFSLLMGVLLACALLVTVYSGRLLRVDSRAIVTGATWMALALGTIAVRRFDAVVSLSLCVALWGTMTRRPLVVGAALGIGAACKIVPLLIAPLLLVHWIAFRRWREIAVAAATGALAMVATSLPFLLEAGWHVLDMFRYHTARPFEAGSTGAALLSIFRIVDPSSAWEVEVYGTSHIVGSGQRVLLPLSTVFLMAAPCAIAAWCWKQTRAARVMPEAPRVAYEALWRATCATLAVSMALGKVLSSQYLVWLLPCGVLVCALDGPRRRTSLVLLGMAMLLTQLNQHIFCGILKNGHPFFGLLVLVRNGLLLAWGIRVLRMAPAKPHRVCLSGGIAAGGLHRGGPDAPQNRSSSAVHEAAASSEHRSNWMGYTMRRRGARTWWIGVVGGACIALPLTSCGGGHSAASPGESADAAAACAVGGPCPICGSDPASAAAANGTTCAPGMVCVEGGCLAACFIDGAPVFAGTRAPSGAACQGCNPKASTSGWSGLDDGSTCGDGGAMVCAVGSCVSGCAIGGQGYAAGAVNPSNACQGCVPTTSTLDWSPVLANGASCGTGKFCFSSTCAPGCSIGGTAYPSDARNQNAANYYCQTCVPGTSETSWTNAADGTACPTATTANGGSCCSGACVDPTSDTSNCGVCGHACTEAPTPTCAGGYCATALGSTGSSGARLAVDANNVYWTTVSTVIQAPIAGGSAMTLASGQIPQDVAVDATNVYFTSNLVGAPLVSIPIGGGTARTLSSTFGGNHIAVRAGYVYGTLGNGGGATGPSVGKLPTSGGTPVSLGPSPGALNGLAVDATNVYWATASAVMKTPIGGGTTTTLVSGNGSPLAVDANNLYYGFDGLGGSNSYGPVLQLPLAGGTPTTLATGLHVVDGITVDAANAYWADNSGSVLRVPIGGGAVTTLAAKQVLCGDIAVDATYVYWITDVGVLKAPK